MRRGVGRSLFVGVFFLGFLNHSRVFSLVGVDASTSQYSVVQELKDKA